MRGRFLGPAEWSCHPEARFPDARTYAVRGLLLQFQQPGRVNQCPDRPVVARAAGVFPQQRVLADGGEEAAPDDSCGGNAGFQGIDLAPDALSIPGRAPSTHQSPAGLSGTSSEKLVHMVEDCEAETRSGVVHPQDEATASPPAAGQVDCESGRQPPPCCAGRLRFPASSGSSARSPD